MQASVQDSSQSTPKNIPRSVGFIMDGNRRWAKARKLPTLEGHRLGFERAKDVMRWCRNAGVQSTVLYAFSTENWGRTEEEVSYLMNLFRHMLFIELPDFKEEGTRIRFIGQKDRLDQDIRAQMEKLEKETSVGTYEAYIAFSYGGRAEILSAVKKAASELSKEEIESMIEADFAKFLWTEDMPNPDIIIRTGGDMRLSNFLPWQSVYSELFFTSTLWPDLSREELMSIFEGYGRRERRKGV